MRKSFRTVKRLTTLLHAHLISLHSLTYHPLTLHLLTYPPPPHTHSSPTHSSKLHHNAAAVQVPIGLEGRHEGVVDIIRNKAYYFEGDQG